MRNEGGLIKTFYVRFALGPKPQHELNFTCLYLPGLSMDPRGAKLAMCI